MPPIRRCRSKPQSTRSRPTRSAAHYHESALAKLPLQHTPVPRPLLRVRAPQRHPHVAVLDPDPIHTPVFSTPRPSRKRPLSHTPPRPRRVSETPIRSLPVPKSPLRLRRVSESPLPPASSRTPLAPENCDAIASQPASKRARLPSSPSMSISCSLRVGTDEAPVSQLRHSALLASPGLFSALDPLTVDSVYSCGGDTPRAPSPPTTQRRISFGVFPDRAVQRNEALSPTPKEHLPSSSARNSGPPRGSTPKQQPHLSPERTKRDIAQEPSQRQASPEPSQQLPLRVPSHQLPNSCEPVLPSSQRSPLTPKLIPSITPQLQISVQQSQASLPSKALTEKPTKSPLTSRVKRTREFGISLSIGNSDCSWAGEFDSPNSAALNIFRRPAQRSGDQTVQVRGISVPKCTPSASIPIASCPSPVVQAKQTPARLKRDPLTTQELEDGISESAEISDKEAEAGSERAAEEVMGAEEKTEEARDASDIVHRDMRMEVSSKLYNNGVEDDCSSTQSPCNMDLNDGKKEGTTKARDTAVYCRSVLVSIPSGALRSFDHSDEPR